MERNSIENSCISRLTANLCVWVHFCYYNKIPEMWQLYQCIYLTYSSGGSTT